MIRQSHDRLVIRAERPGLKDFTPDLAAWLAGQAVDNGLLTLFCTHTSASLLIQENAAPAARGDLEAYFARIAPEGPDYEHDDEGPDDMPAHLRSALTPTQLAIPVVGGKLALGRWQGVYLFEHLRIPRPRTILLHLLGE